MSAESWADDLVVSKEQLLEIRWVAHWAGERVDELELYWVDLLVKQMVGWWERQ